MLARLRLLLELIRFSHTIFALPFALLSAVLAWRGQQVRWQELVGILLCMLFARSAAMAFNRLVDREIDAQNPRTQGRHLPRRPDQCPYCHNFYDPDFAGIYRLDTPVSA